MRQNYQESLLKRAKERAYLASLSFGNQFPIPGFYFIKEYGQLHYKDGIHHQMAKVNWKVDQDDPWLEECLFIVNLSPLLHYYSKGPKDISYPTLLNKILKVENAFIAQTLKDGRLVETKTVEWEFINNYTIPDILIMENPLIRQLIYDEEDKKWDTLATLNSVDDYPCEDIFEEDDLLIYEDGLDELPDDDQDLNTNDQE